MKDIGNKEDIEHLIRTFYTELLKIEDMKRVFAGIDLESHIPRIVHFWSFVLLDEPGYTTNVFQKHLGLPIKPEQFDVWVETFVKTTDSLYSGEKAELARQRAQVLGFTFKSKWLQTGKG